MDGGASPSSGASWDEVKEARRRYLDSVCELMREAVPVKDIRSFGFSYRNCLDAKEITAWLVAADLCHDAKDAVDIGRSLQKQKYIVHIWGSHTTLVPFANSSMYFRFNEKGMQAKAPPTPAGQTSLKGASVEMKRAASRVFLDAPSSELEPEEDAAGQASSEEVDGEGASPCASSHAALPAGGGTESPGSS
eukprot:CAMPEP_0171257040 /NCGR_PEP_ID=MMETSP0790-20130122/53629_1 /TAXON_ID=2925 /ORGANISM="Alexandrium catenella, Strain OF101" /LENGTH=191 /DNA_ID=CAMNT_0011725115 /DNA_START=43 /DNA_END=615 /DNA_ORIENTATION=+